jgi:predicted phosphatase
MDFKVGNSRYKLSSPLPDILQLLHYFLAQVPGKDQHPVRFVASKIVFVNDRDTAARHIFSLFGWITVCDILQEIRSYA